MKIPVYGWRRDTDARGRPAWVTTDPLHPDTREVWIVTLDGVPVWRFVAVHCPAGALHTESWADHYHLCTAGSLTGAARMVTGWLYGERLCNLAWAELQRAGALPTD